MSRIFKRGKKSKPVYNVDLRVDDIPFPGVHRLPYIGFFTVMSDGQLRRGPTDGLDTLTGTVDMASTPPLHVDFQSGDHGYLSRKDKSYFLKRNAMEITEEVVKNTGLFALRFRT